MFSSREIDARRHLISIASHGLSNGPDLDIAKTDRLETINAGIAVFSKQSGLDFNRWQ
jgi:hypothetical protein